MKLRIEYYYDGEATRWGFTVPALRIVGGGDSRADAEARAIEAVTYALEGVAADDDVAADVEVGYLDVAITPARPLRTAMVSGL